MAVRVSDHSAITIRELKREDCEDLSRFFADNDKPDIVAQFHPFPLSLTTALQLTQQPTRDLYYIALEQDLIVGLCMLRGWQDGYEIPSLGVIVDHRRIGLGIGMQLTRFAIDKARLRGCPAVRLSVHESNTKALQLYRMLDFVEASREAANGDAKIIMTKDLSSSEGRKQ